MVLIISTSWSVDTQQLERPYQSVVMETSHETEILIQGTLEIPWGIQFQRFCPLVHAWMIEPDWLACSCRCRRMRHRGVSPRIGREGFVVVKPGKYVRGE